jgi:uncharacterized repeat protein (TIGR03803 family)
MKLMKRVRALTLPLALVIVAFLALAVPFTYAQTAVGHSALYQEKVLFNFMDASTGYGPRGGLVQDASGNFYGTALGGTYLNGVVYKLNTDGNETILHNFTGGSDGGYPEGSLVIDGQGNLYGTTSAGGNSQCQCGVVYKLNPQGTETVLYTFTDAIQGFGPGAGLAMDQAGNLYGMSVTSGPYQLGNIFKIDTAGNYSVLHNFMAWDGETPYLAPVVLDAAGNLYGVAAYGGATTQGVVFKLDPSDQFTMLYNFTLGQDGGFPTGPVAIDSAGNIYGATYEGGNPPGGSGAGVAFQLQPSGKYSVLYTFSGSGPSGSYGGGVILGQDGNLYGTTIHDGPDHSGNVFKITPAGQVLILHNFTGGLDGGGIAASVIEDSAGNIYGTAEVGGTTGYGVVFELSPN